MAVSTDGLAAGVRTLGRSLAERIGASFVAQGQQFAPRRTGAGADSITVESIDENGDTFVVRIVVGEIYMRYQNEGTGIYGPEGTEIVPVNGKVLVFDSAVGGGMVFAHSVRGTEPTHWWDRTVDAWGTIVRDV